LAKSRPSTPKPFAVPDHWLASVKLASCVGRAFVES
jgi:hypothetical protein